jgi:amidase
MARRIEDLETAGAAVVAQAVADRQVSALEVTDAAIARIEARDGEVNAVVVRDFKRARDQARAVDAAVARGERLPLMGVPMTVKEPFNIAGLPTTFGLEAARNYRPTEDARSVVRLKAAGAVVLGKSNIPVVMRDMQTDNPVYGRTRNPHNLAYSPGGSSGGSAAALAAGMVPLELGGDAGGSIRIPSSYCGVYGHASSFGIISLEGHGPPGGGIVVGRAWGVAGPMARSAEDLELGLGVLAGPEGRDAKAYRLALPPARHERLGDYRVLVLTEHPRFPVDNEVLAAIGELEGNLRRAGVKVARESALVPTFSELESAFDAFAEVGKASVSVPGFGTSGATAKDYYDVVRVQEVIRRKWDAFFADYDVVVAPCAPTAAHPLSAEGDPEKRSLVINDASFPYWSAQQVWPTLAIPWRLPATAAPIGKTAAGLPIGVQFIGPYLEDRTTIAFAKLLEAEFGPGSQPVDPTAKRVTADLLR